MIGLHLDNAGAQSEILHYLKYAKKRLSKYGIEYFGSGVTTEFGIENFGSRVTAKKELNWFSGFSCNSGLKAGKANDFELFVGI